MIYRAVSAVESGLLNTPPANLGFAKAASAAGVVPEKDDKGNAVFPHAKLEIENGVHQLETLLEATVDKDFDKLEIYCLRNVLYVPEDVVGWVRLKHYEVGCFIRPEKQSDTKYWIEQNLDLDPGPDAPTPDTIAALRSQLHETQSLHTALLHESARNEALLSHLRAILSPPQFTNGPPDSTSASPFSFLDAQSLPATGEPTQHLTTTSAFLTSQLPALRSLLASLRPKISNHALPSTNPDDEPSAQEERRLYIEGQTRRHLVRTRGLEFEDDGSVRDGEWIGGGRKVGADEVAALENVVAGLEHGKGEEERMEE